MMGDAKADLEDNVLQESVLFDSVVNLWLIFFWQVNRLRVAAALEVEDSVIVPPFQHKKKQQKTAKKWIKKKEKEKKNKAKNKENKENKKNKENKEF